MNRTTKAAQAAQAVPDSWRGSPYLRWPLVSMQALGPLPTSAAFARTHTRNVLTEWGLPHDMIGDAKTVVSEIATNALQATWTLAEAHPIALWLLANHRLPRVRRDVPGA